MRTRIFGIAFLIAACVTGSGWADELKIDFEGARCHEGDLNGQDSWQDSLGIHKITADGALAGKQSLQIAQPPPPNTADEYSQTGNEYAIRKISVDRGFVQWSMLVKPIKEGEFHGRFDAEQGGPANVAGFYLDTRPAVRRVSGTEGGRFGKEGDVVVGNTYRVTVLFDFDPQQYTVKVDGIGNPTSISETFPFARGNMTREQAAAGSILFRNVLLNDFDGKTLVDDITLGPKP